MQLSNLKPSILQTENSIRIAKLMLKMYLSIPEQVDIEVEGELDAMRDKVLAGTEGLTTDTSDNSDLRTLELQEDRSAFQLKAENASRRRPSGRSATSPSPGTTWARCRSIRTR